MKTQHTPAASLFTQLIIETFKLHGQVMASGDALIQDIGLTSALWQVLHIIDIEPSPVAQIARQLGITRQSVLRTVNTLKKKDLIALCDNPHHQRARLVTLLDEGKKKLEIAKARQVAWATEQVENIPLRQLQECIACMQTIRENLTKT